MTAPVVNPRRSALQEITARAEEFTLEPGFVSLFNGKDLTGWRYGEKESFDGKTVLEEDDVAPAALREVIGEEARTVCDLQELQPLFVELLQGRVATVNPIEYAKGGLRHGMVSPFCYDLNRNHRPTPSLLYNDSRLPTALHDL